MAENLTEKEFKEKVFDYSQGGEWAYKGDKPAIVDFWAPWCVPCKMVSPILEDISAEFTDKLHVYKVNVDENQEISMAFGIQSIPTILFIPQEGQPQASLGALPEASIKEAMKEILGVE